MVYVDNIKDEHEIVLLGKIGVGLGFHPENVKYIDSRKALQSLSWFSDRAMMCAVVSSSTTAQ